MYGRQQGSRGENPHQKTSTSSVAHASLGGGAGDAVAAVLGIRSDGRKSESSAQQSESASNEGERLHLQHTLQSSTVLLFYFSHDQANMATAKLLHDE